MGKAKDTNLQPLWPATTDNRAPAAQVPGHTLCWQLDAATPTTRWRSHCMDVTLEQGIRKV